MSYREYQEMISGKKQGPLPPGWEARDFKFDDEQYGSWYGTGYLKDGVPIICHFYLWDASNRQIQDAVEKVFGKYILVRWNGGQGHYQAEFEAAE